MIKKYSKLFALTLLMLFVSMITTNAKEMTAQELGTEILETQPNAGHVYVIGSYAFTSEYAAKYDLKDIMLASADSIDANIEGVKSKTDLEALSETMTIYEIDRISETEWKFKGKVVGNGTAFDNANNKVEIKYIDYEYVRKDFTVTFELGNGKDDIKVNVKEFDKVTPQEVTVEGKVFDGWYLGADPYDFDTEITGDITLTAHWKNAPTLNSTLVTETETNEQVSYEVKISDVGDFNGKNVIGEWSITKDGVDATDKVNILYYETGIEPQDWKTLTGHSFGPTGGFPLTASATSQFKATFTEAGVYTYTITIKEVETNRVLTTLTNTITVRDKAEVNVDGYINTATHEINTSKFTATEVAAGQVEVTIVDVSAGLVAGLGTNAYSILESLLDDPGVESIDFAYSGVTLNVTKDDLSFSKLLNWFKANCGRIFDGKEYGDIVSYDLNGKEFTATINLGKDTTKDYYNTDGAKNVTYTISFTGTPVEISIDELIESSEDLLNTTKYTTTIVDNNVTITAVDPNTSIFLGMGSGVINILENILEDNNVKEIEFSYQTGSEEIKYTLTEDSLDNMDYYTWLKNNSLKIFGKEGFLNITNQDLSGKTFTATIKLEDYAKLSNGNNYSVYTFNFQ